MRSAPYGRDDKDTIGLVLAPEAIAKSIFERLVSGVYHSGTLDVIGLYEECLEHFGAHWVRCSQTTLAERASQTLQVRYEASRGLLQKTNEFSEEVAIMNDVLKQQNNVLLQFRSSLDPTSFGTPSLARKLRFKYECKGIGKILMKIT